MTPPDDERIWPHVVALFVVLALLAVSWILVWLAMPKTTP